MSLKRNTWCGALDDFRSQIKYSYTPLIYATSVEKLCRQWQRWRVTQTDADGNPNVFNLNHDDGSLWLNDNWTNPDNQLNSDNEFVFRLSQYYLFRGFTSCGFSFPC